MRRDFTYIDDIVAGIIGAASRPDAVSNGDTSLANSRVYNLGNNHPAELRELISMLEECLGVTAECKMKEMQPGDVPATYADIETAQRDLDFRPQTPLRQGLERFIAWYREYHRDPSSNSQQLAAAVVRQA